MVALKLSSGSAAFIIANKKQERRGGIEIGPGSPGPAGGKAKQERRGGIEIGGRRRSPTTAAPSRNAVVALKSAARIRAAAAGSGKQERRGGIEIMPGQEGSDPAMAEAGTPWWH